MSPIGCFIFDLDGTLVDTETIANESWKKAEERLSFKMDEKVLFGMKGANHASAKIVFDSFYQAHPTFEEARLARDYFFNKRLDEAPIPLLPGVKETLTYLKEHDIDMAIASSSRRRYVEFVTTSTGIRKYFSSLVCGDEVKESKPNPAIFEAARNMAHMEVNECAVVEDSINGVKAGRNGSFLVIGIPNAIPFDEETTAHCDYVFLSMFEMLEAIKDGRIPLLKK